MLHFLGSLPDAHRIRVLEGIIQILHSTVECEDPAEIAHTCLQVAMTLTDSPMGWVGILNDKGNFDSLAMSPLAWDACAMLEHGDVSALQNLPIRGLWGVPYRTGEPLITNDPTNHPSWRGLPEGHPPITRLVSYPLKKQGVVFGSICLGNAPVDYTQQDLNILGALATPCATALCRIQMLHSLAAQAARLEGILQSISSGVVMYDAVDDGEDFIILEVNQATEAIEGLPLQELVGKRLTQCFPGAEDFGILDVLRRVWKTGQPESLPESYYADDHTEGWRHNEVFKLPSGELVTVYSDITKEVTHRRSLEVLNQQLMEANEELERFAYVASHDLREPLNKIVAFGERFKSTVKECPFQEKTNNTCGKAETYLDIMINATRRMDSLVMDLLAYSRAGKNEGTSVTSVDMVAIVEDIWESLSVVVYDKEATLEYGELPLVWAEKVPIHQMFNNLITNALKFIHPDRPAHVTITTVMHEEDHQVEIIVADNGIGFEPQFAEEIFGVFSRLHSRFEYPGTGMGLALVRRIARRYGGNVIAVGVPGEGASFHVKLPVVEAADG